MAAKKKKTMRKKGEPLPLMVPSARVLRALEAWSIKESEFLKEYDLAAGSRGRGGELSDAQIKAIEKYQEDLDIEVLKKALKVKTDSAALNAIKRWRELPG